MSEPGDHPPDDGSEATSQLDRALDSLKRAVDDADDDPVSSDGRTRMSWSSVTEADPAPADRTEAPGPKASSFQFDLGSALARLGDEPLPTSLRGGASAPIEEAPPTTRSEPADPEPADDLPRRGTDPVPDVAPDALPGDDLPRRTAEPTDVRPDDPLPRRESTPSAAPAAASRSAAPAPSPAPAEPSRTSSRRSSSSQSPAADRSVFDDAAPAPSLPANPQRAPRSEPSAPQIPAATAAGLPTLPEVNPVAAPMIAEPVSSAPATPDINAVRSYQLRAQRDERRSKIFGRSLLAVLILGGAVAAALIFGRSYLFPTQWDAELTPIVDQIQEARGGEFDDTVSLRILPDAEYAAVALEIAVGPEWDDELPAWRALGIASGGGSSDAIHRAVIAWRPALYDPVTDTVFRATNVEPAALASAYTLALNEVFERQQATPPNTAFADEAGGVLGVSSPQAISSHAIDVALRGGEVSAAPLLEDTQAPLPLLYQFAAIDTLGPPLLALPDGQGLRYGDAYPESLLTAVSVGSNRAVSGLAPAGTESLAEPVALGPDAWAMVWENRLPVRTVERLSTLISADSYRPIAQGATRCFVANFQATSDSAAGEVLGALSRWTAAAPETAGAVASLVAPNRVELFACDPGAAADQPVNPAAVASVLATQIARLAGS